MSIHKLFVGTSLAGKSTLARQMAFEYDSDGMDVVVLDELMDDKWVSEGHAAMVTDNEREFLQTFWASRRLAVFIDESQESVGRYNKAMTKTATRGRHWGHICHYLVQNPSEISPTVRKQCGEIFMFQCDEKTAQFLATEFIQPALEKGPSLAQGEYIRAVRFGPDRRPYYELGRAF